MINLSIYLSTLPTIYPNIYHGKSNYIFLSTYLKSQLFTQISTMINLPIYLSTLPTSYPNIYRDISTYLPYQLSIQIVYHEISTYLSIKVSAYLHWIPWIL